MLSWENQLSCRGKIIRPDLIAGNSIDFDTAVFPVMMNIMLMLIMKESIYTILYIG